MTEQHIAAIARGIAPVLKAFMVGVSERIAALETVERKMGPPGPPGPQGERGQDGMSIPGVPGRDGEKGTNGRDGLGFDDWKIRSDDTGCYLCLQKGDRVKEERLPIPYDRGIWKSGTAYHKGDEVSWNGSLWRAGGDTNEKPGQGATAWRLAVKQGDTGRIGPQGPSGKDGRDLTQMDSTGRKWGQ